MCGRFTRIDPLQAILKRFRIARSLVTEAPPDYNIAPSKEIMIVNDEGERRLLPAHWGFLPAWAKDPAIGTGMINARAETVADKPAFRSAFKNHRCLIVANGFYEWEKRERKKYPVYIKLRSDEPFGFAGLYTFWHSPEGDTLCTCTIITTEANELIRPIHDRMPVITPKHQEDLWLNPTEHDRETLLPLLRPYPAAEMELYLVSSRMNSPVYNDSENIRPLQAQSFFNQER